VARLVSFAQNAEDIRVWRAFRDHDPRSLRYVDVGANEPRALSITASLYDLGWRGLLIEADPELAHELGTFRPGDTVVEMAAAAGPGELTFHRVPGTGLGTLDAGEAAHARARGFDVDAVTVITDSLDAILDRLEPGDIHFMSIDVEGAEAVVLSGLSLDRHRPWVLCIEAVHPGTDERSSASWEPGLLARGYSFCAFDGVNCWYVANEHIELAEAIATPYNALDAGMHGWVPADRDVVARAANRAAIRRSWQRELILNDARSTVPMREVEQQISELRTALALVEASRSWRYTRKLGKAVRVAQHRLRLAVERLPGPLRAGIVRRRHLAHVQANLDQLVDPAYLGRVPAFTVDWITPEGMPVVPIEGLGFTPLDREQASAVRTWLDSGPYDDDAMLERRTDNHDDELGRVMAALRTRLRLAIVPDVPAPASGNRVLIDARSLQTAAFGTRGIGRFARSALEGVRSALGDDKVVLLVDPGLERLPSDLAGDCEQITRVTDASVGRFSVLIQPSPMTASADPLVPLLYSTAHRIAIVYDVIPMHYPSVYLRHAGARAEYAAALDALRCYDEFVCISQTVQRELAGVLNRTDVVSSVAWPASIANVRKVKAGTPAGPIVVMTGDEPRKNTYGALAAIGAATAGSDEPRDVLVIGMAGQDTRVHHWSIHAALRPGEAVTAGRLSDDEMLATLHSAALVIVPSFDEGLSLPVIEAISCGANVVASDTLAHRELIGRGGYLVDPRNLRAFARTIRRYAGTRRSYPRQQSRLIAHRHGVLEQVLAERTLAKLGKTTVALPPAKIHATGSALSIGLATPWTPQKSGVADFSATIGRELAGLCDLTVYTTSDARVEAPIRHASIDSVIARGSTDHDVLVTVLGNSHFHTTFLEVMRQVDSVAVLHDTRMVEYYLALRGPGGVSDLMLRGTGRRSLTPSLDEQINDMRLLQNAGLWEIAQRARALVMHSPCAAPLVEAQNGVRPFLLPFANQRVPETDTVTVEDRRAARARLGWADDRIHLGTFGYVDIRTKMTDLVVESAAWLQQWGHPVALHVAGSAQPTLAEQLHRRAREAGLVDFEITGFLSEEAFRDHLLAVDAGVQLRVSPVLGVSGPLSDLAAWGTPAVASMGLAIDVDTPDYVHRLPDEASPVMVAAAIEELIAQPADTKMREAQRRDYLDAKSAARYAEGLLRILQEVVR
jgi:FkbM family methyltransferase